MRKHNTEFSTQTFHRLFLYPFLSFIHSFLERGEGRDRGIGRRRILSRLHTQPDMGLHLPTLRS